MNSEITNQPYVVEERNRLKQFIRTFKGVSTKYLNNYLVWYNLVEYAKETVTEKEQIFLSIVLTTQINEKCRDRSKQTSNSVGRINPNL